MDSEIIAALIGAAVATAFGIAGFITALVSNSRTKKANKLAKSANKIATDALAQARESNEIAKNANNLSEEANTISRSNAAKQSDPAHIDWAVEWDTETATVKVTNTGRDTARKASILIQGGEIDELIKWDGDAPRNTSLGIPLPQIAQDRKQHNIEESSRIRQMVGAGFIVGASTFTYGLIVDVRWETELGNPGFEQYHLTAS